MPTYRISRMDGKEGAPETMEITADSDAAAIEEVVSLARGADGNDLRIDVGLADGKTCSIIRIFRSQTAS